MLSPPCLTEEDKYSLEALRTIHKQVDDDKDGGIEVDESDEVGAENTLLCVCGKAKTHPTVFCQIPCSRGVTLSA